MVDAVNKSDVSHSGKATTSNPIFKHGTFVLPPYHLMHSVQQYSHAGVH